MTLVYTTIAIIVQHSRGRSKKKGWLITFIVFDVCFCAADLAIFSLLSRAGLPVHCQNLTHLRESERLHIMPVLFPPLTIRLGPEFEQESGYDWRDDTFYNTEGFSDEQGPNRGRLDRFCGFERSFYVISLILVFTYMITIVLGALGVYETSHTKNDRVNELLDSLERANSEIDVKMLDASLLSPLLENPRSAATAPQSEGYITRTASLRSTMTSVTTSTAAHSNHHHSQSYSHHRPNNVIPRRPIGHPAAPPLPARPSQDSPTKEPSLPGPTLPGVGFVPISLEQDSSADAALVADGMQHRTNSNQLSHSSSSSQLMSQQLHQPRISISMPPMPLPMLLEEEQTADSALVSDGMRPSEPMLPPYEPGRGPTMAGHAGEDNDMRLSEYVKGGTRAQDIKDSGRY